MKCAHKYAPKSLDEVIFQDPTVERRVTSYANKMLEGNIILHGPNGTGKTTVAELLVTCIGGDGADREQRSAEELLKMDDLKEYLLRAASLARMSSSKYFLVFHEFDEVKKNLPKLWTALDECGNDVMTIITTNKPMELHASIRSRFDLVEMTGLSASSVLPRVQEILNAEGIKLPDHQVLHYLKTKENFKDLRKYFAVVDELLLLQKLGQPFPSVSPQRPALQVI